MVIDLEPDSDYSKVKSYPEAISKNNFKPVDNQLNLESTLLKPIPKPVIIGGNVVVALDVDDYKRGVEHLKDNVLGRLTL